MEIWVVLKNEHANTDCSQNRNGMGKRSSNQTKTHCQGRRAIEGEKLGMRWPRNPKAHLFDIVSYLYMNSSFKHSFVI
jgi:hypothetical protein